MAILLATGLSAFDGYYGVVGYGLVPVAFGLGYPSLVYGGGWGYGYGLGLGYSGLLF